MKKSNNDNSGLYLLATLSLASFVISFLIVLSALIKPPISIPIEASLIDKEILYNKSLFLIQFDSEQKVVQVSAEDYFKFKKGNNLYLISKPFEPDLDIPVPSNNSMSTVDLFILLKGSPLSYSLNTKELKQEELDQFTTLYPSLDTARTALEESKTELKTYKYLCIFSLILSIVLFVLPSMTKKHI